MVTNFICNKFGGIRRKNAMFSSDLISCTDMQNIELYFSGLNSGVGIRTMEGNTSIYDSFATGERVVNIFESVQNNTTYFFVHTTNGTVGKLYNFDVANETLTPLISDMSATTTSNGVDFMQGQSDLFIFCNGTDYMYKIEMSAATQVTQLSVSDSEGRAIKPKAVLNYNGRVFAIMKNRLHWCVQQDVTDWSTSDPEITTSAGYNEFVKEITAFTNYLTSIAIFFKDSSVLFSGEYPDFQTTEESPGGCAGINALVFHGTDLYFYDHTKKGIFSFQQVVLGNKTLGDNIALDIQDELSNIDSTRLEDVKAISVVLSDRNEIWLLTPTTDVNYSTIMIYDSLRGEWVKRKCPKVYSFAMIDSNLFSAGLKIYSEYNGDDFDGTFIKNSYECSPFNLGSNTSLKIAIFRPRLTVDLPKINNFHVSYTKNLNKFTKTKDKAIKAKYKDYGIWGQSYWGQCYWAGSRTSPIVKCPNLSAFQSITIKFHTTAKTENFAIKQIEMNEIDTVQI